MDETVRLTYGELAKARGITLAAARRMTLRHKWPKQVGNDGMTRVDVPASALAHTGDAPVAAPGDVPAIPPLTEASIPAIADATAAAVVAATADVRHILPTLQEAITSLRVELYAERELRERAERELRELRAQLARRRRWWWRR